MNFTVIRRGITTKAGIPTTLVGPSSVHSHLRPVRYATNEDSKPNHHPYEPTNNFYEYSAEELSFDLSRRRLDNFNERFWSDNNIRCEQAMKAYVGDAQGEERQVLLQKFWMDWVSNFTVYTSPNKPQSEANKARYLNWSKEWWKSQLSLLYPAFKISVKQLYRRFL